MAFHQHKIDILVVTYCKLGFSQGQPALSKLMSHKALSCFFPMAYIQSLYCKPNLNNWATRCCWLCCKHWCSVKIGTQNVGTQARAKDKTVYFQCNLHLEVSYYYRTP